MGGGTPPFTTQIVISGWTEGMSAFYGGYRNGADICFIKMATKLSEAGRVQLHPTTGTTVKLVKFKQL